MLPRHLIIATPVGEDIILPLLRVRLHSISCCSPLHPNFFVQPCHRYRGDDKRCRRRHLLSITLRQGDKSLCIYCKQYLHCAVFPFGYPFCLCVVKTWSDSRQYHLSVFATDTPVKFELVCEVRLTWLINRLVCLQVLAKRKTKKGFLKGKN